MLARSSRLRHPLGVNIPTPILVPSFSSKGFKFRKNGSSEITEIINVTSEWLTETLLVSAHDIHYGYVPSNLYSVVDLVFVDSGGYEKSKDNDFSSVYATTGSNNIWNKDLLKEVYDSLPSDNPFVLVSYDLIGTPILEQIEAASDLFSNYKNSLHTILLKPESDESEKENQTYIEIQSVLRYITELGKFDIIGFTEKELGNSLLKRMVNIARVRQELDRNRIASPIHIFGSLDTVASILYFLAGAEIFDGLTWLRYSYLNGVTTYQHNYGALNLGIHQRDDSVRARAFVENINYLQDIKYQMKSYLLEGKFDKFKHNPEFFRSSYDGLCAELGGLV